MKRKMSAVLKFGFSVGKSWLILDDNWKVPNTPENEILVPKYQALDAKAMKLNRKVRRLQAQLRKLMKTP